MRNRVGLRPGLDLRGDGGVIVAPPSVHPSGKPYAWVPGLGPDEQPPASLPEWLEYVLEVSEAKGHPTSYWRSVAREGVTEGTRNNTIACGRSCRATW